MTALALLEPPPFQLWPVARLSPHARRDLIPPQDEARYQELEKDISKRGILVPLCVTPEGRVLCGHHRLRAAIELGIAEVPVVILSGLTPEQERSHMLHDNLNRRHMTPGQRAALVTRPELAFVLKHFQAQARLRQARGGHAGGRIGGRGRPLNRLVERVPQPYSRAEQRRTRDLLGHFGRVSGRFIADALLVCDKAPERMESVLRGDARPSLSSIARELRRLERDLKGGKDPGARTIHLPPQAAGEGDPEAELQAVVQASSREIIFVWRLLDGAPPGTVVLQRVPDRRDPQDRAGPSTTLAHLVESLTYGPDGPSVELSRLIGRRFSIAPGTRDGMQVIAVRSSRDHPYCVGIAR